MQCFGGADRWHAFLVITCSHHADITGGVTGFEWWCQEPRTGAVGVGCVCVGSKVQVVWGLIALQLRFLSLVICVHQQPSGAHLGPHLGQARWISVEVRNVQTAMV